MGKYSREQLIALVENSARGCGVPTAIAVAQIARESWNFREDVVYGPYVAAAGERGMSQFIPDTWARFGSGPHTNAYDPDQSMAAWCRYMSYLQGLFGSDWSKVLTGYNGGEGHLTNPERHGPPSSAALRYAAEILAQAGSAPDGGGSGADGGGSGAGLATWLLIGGAIAVGWVLLADD